MLHPITFSIPSEKICETNNIKTKILSNLIPGRLNTYIYNTEEEYYNEYKKSYFAITIKKGGFDCMRHYEILANGCIPHFIGIEECPPYTMYLLPKELFIEANILYNDKFKNKNIDDITEESKNEYNILNKKLLEYTKQVLTTDKVAKYILTKTNHENVSKILFLTGNPSADYLPCLTLHGFKTLFGNMCHDSPKNQHIYKSHNIDFKKIYGKGFSYSNLLEQNLHNNVLDDTILEDIKNKYYDIVVYGSYHRGMPYYDLVNKIYKQNKIILLCGEDLHKCNNHMPLTAGHHVFVRELNAAVVILYGIVHSRINVTDTCLNTLFHSNVIRIPRTDGQRARFFTDPLVGTEKKIFIIINGVETEYDQYCEIKINMVDFSINVQTDNEINKKIHDIHTKIKIKYGSLLHELPEQKMVTRYLTGKEKVLEIGGNIGRNSMVIASIIDNNNFVSMESDTNIANQLKENMELNNYTFNIADCALSKRRLIQSGWNTKPSNVLEKGYKWVNTINFNELSLKYNITFDTLVLDCEGAFYYILLDMPEMLTNINLIIMENDYLDIGHKNYVDAVLTKYKFYNDYREVGGWGCCQHMFFEVWKKSEV